MDILLGQNPTIRICLGTLHLNRKFFPDHHRYTDTKLYFQIYSTSSSISEGADVLNYRESLFEVLPTSSFQINDEMNSTEDQKKKADSAPRARTQAEQFKAIIGEKRRKSIFFGDKVVFRHLDSKYYLYGSFDCAQSGIGAFKIQLRKELSQKIVFKLISYRTYEKNGDQISIDAPLKIFHCETQCFLSFCSEPNFIDYETDKIFKGEKVDPYIQSLKEVRIRRKLNPPFIKNYYMLKKEEGNKYISYGEGSDQQQASFSRSDAQPPILSARYEIINENIAKRIWKFQPYHDVEPKINKQIIRQHDIVYLLHTDDQKYLCPDNFDEGNIFLNKRVNEAEKTNIFDGLWEIQIPQFALDDNLGNGGVAQRADKSQKEKKGQNPKKTQNNLGISTSMNINMTSLRATGNLRKTGNFGNTSQRVSSQTAPQGSQKGGNFYALRHLISGRMLYFQSISDSRQHKQKAKIKLIHPINERNRHDQKYNARYGYVILNCQESKDGALARIQLQDGKDGLFLQISSHKKNNKLKTNESKAAQSMMVAHDGDRDHVDLREDDIDLAYKSYFQTEELQITNDSSKHGFRIYKAEDLIKQIILMIMSSQEVIHKFTCFLHNFEGNDIDHQTLTVSLLNNIINVLKELRGFIYQTEYQKIASSGNSPNPLKQKAFVETGMIELITVLLNKIDDKQEMFTQLNSASKEKKIRTIFALGYELLESMAANNYQVKMKISKYLQIYLEHIKKNSNRIVYESIQEILDGNELALEKKVQKTFLRDLIETFTEGDPSDLQFLSKLCLCRDQTVKKNQDAVFLYFYDSKNNEDNKFIFKEDHGKFLIVSKISKKKNAQVRTLHELYIDCQLSLMGGIIDSAKGHWNYFITYLNLLADVCVHRNPTALQYIRQSLPLKTLDEFIGEQTVRKKMIYQPFIRLVLHAFVETERFGELNRITKVKKWNELEQEKMVIQKAKDDPFQYFPELPNIMKLVRGYFAKINLEPWLNYEQSLKRDKEKAFQKIDDDQKEPQTVEFDPMKKQTLKSVKTFLEFLKSTLALGFWGQIQDLRILAPYMLKIISFDIEFANRNTQMYEKQKAFLYINDRDFQQKSYRKTKQELKLNKPNVVLLVECKILAAKILNIMIDYETSIRVSIITKHFKDVQEQRVNLQQYEYDEQNFRNKWKHDRQFDLFMPINEKEGYLMNASLWKDKINQIIQKRSLFIYAEQYKINKLLTLFEGFVYENQELTNIILQILIRITNKRRGILRTFKEIILVAGGNLNKLTDRAAQTRTNLLVLVNPQVREVDIQRHNDLWKQNNRQNINDPKIGSIQQLAFLTMSMKKNVKVTDYRASYLYSREDLYPFDGDEIYEDREPKDRSYRVITEKEQNNPLNQNLIKSQGHHTIIIDFLKIMKKPTKVSGPYKALHASYNFLTTLVWNNRENKKQLEPILQQTISHIGINCGCIDFFSEMYKNNKKLVIKTDVTKIVSQVIEQANKLDITSYLKSKLLDFLRNIILFDNKGITKNQNIVMQIISQIQVSDNNQIVLVKEKGISKTVSHQHAAWVLAYSGRYEKSLLLYQDLDVGPELFYVATFFEIFSALIENQNKVNIGKCNNMHPHVTLVRDWLPSYRLCWPVIRHLRSYVNKLYYFETRERQSQLIKQFTNFDIKNIQQQLQAILQLISSSPDYHTIKIANPIRYSYIGSYVYLTLEEDLHSLSLMLPTIKSEEKSEEVCFALLYIMEMIQYFMKTIDGRYINKYLQDVGRIVKNLIVEIPLPIIRRFLDNQRDVILENISENKLSSQETLFRKNYVFHQQKGFWHHLIDWNAHTEQEILRQKAINAFAKRGDNPLGDGKGDEEKKMKEFLIEKLCLANIQKRVLLRNPEKRRDKQEKIEDPPSQNEDNPQQKESVLPKNLLPSQSQRFKVKNERFLNAEQKNAVINARRRKLVKFIEVNSEFQQYSDEETKNYLYETFAKLKQISEQQYGIEVVGNSDVIKALVEMNRKNFKFINEEFKVQVIKMFSDFIKRNSTVFDKDISEWAFSEEEEGEESSELSKIRAAQNFLNECGCASFLCSLIENDLSLSLKMGTQIMTFGILLFIGKNRKVQGSMLQLLKSDVRNIILTQIQQQIKKNSLSIFMTLAEAPEPKNYGEINYSDTYDFYNNGEKIMERKFEYEPQTVLQQKQFKDKLTFLQKIFFFLKVLCQGSEQSIIELKNYIREQVSNDEQKKPKTQSINFIGLAASQLKRLLATPKMQIMKVTFSIVNFLNEVIEIPCIQNQLFLCKNTLYFNYFAQLEKQVIEGSTVASLLSEPNPSDKQIQNAKLILKEFFVLSIKSCNSCLQGNHKEIRVSLATKQLAYYYCFLLKFYVNQLKLNDAWKFNTVEELEKKMREKKTFEKQILDLFNITRVMKKLNSPQSSFSSHLEDFLKKADVTSYFELFQKNMLGIQISMDKVEVQIDLRQYIYFPKHPVYSYLSRSTRQIVMEQINRSTQRDKIIGLIEAKSQITEEMNYNFDLDHMYSFSGINIPISASRIHKYKDISLGLAAFICLMLFFFAWVLYYPEDNEIVYELGSYSILFGALSSLQLLFSLVYTTLWMKNHIELAIKRYQAELAKQEEDDEGEKKQGFFDHIKNNISEKLFLIPGFLKIYCLMNYDRDFWNLVLFLFGSLAGNFYRIQCFSILLINIMMEQMDVLRSVIDAIVASTRMLGMLSLLGTSFIGIFSIFAINHYVSSLYEDELPNQHCQSVVDCIITLYINEQINSEMESFQAGRFMYDMAFVIFMDTLFGNIVGGVLIDTFAELRSRRDEVNEDKEGKCFICGITRETLEKKNESIKTHYQKEFHKLWNYIFYLYNLDLNKRKVGLEFIIADKIKSQDVSWIPIQGAGEEDLGEKIAELEEAIESQRKFIDELEVVDS